MQSSVLSIEMGASQPLSPNSGTVKIPRSQLVAQAPPAELVCMPKSEMTFNGGPEATGAQIIGLREQYSL